MKKRYLLILMFLTGSFAAFTQEIIQPETAIEPIQTDRPDQTETPALTPRGMFQMENGFAYEKVRGDLKNYVAPTSLLKYGLSENFELRFIAEYVISDSLTEQISGFAPLLFGFKVKISEESGLIPKTSLIAHMSVPTWASKKFRTDYYAPEFRFVMQHTLTPNMSFSYNLGAEWDGFVAEPTFIYTVATGFSLGGGFGGFVEFYGFVPQEIKPDHRFDGGLTYLVTDNFMLDTSAGVGLSDDSPEYFVSFGFSFRI